MYIYIYIYSNGQVPLPRKRRASQMQRVKKGTRGRTERVNAVVADLSFDSLCNAPDHETPI